ncbi:c-type cytochrome [Flavobacterium sp. I3-2]|uniref:c-type cytochrome n=1 Tax=Flavobacterium sp. I3-2 TaxID=2748319 RepID=UPI0015AD3383|nr:c-type cytochrome [Flavobacterium sp. I3-2]
MKQFLTLALLAISLVSCGSKEEKKEENLYPETTLSAEEKTIANGKELFESNKAACATCHLPDKKVIGPSIKEIAKIYKEQNASIFDFLRQKSEPIVDPSQYEVMKTNFAIIKTFSDEEIKSLEAYMMSL